MLSFALSVSFLTHCVISLRSSRDGSNAANEPSWWPNAWPHEPLWFLTELRHAGTTTQHKYGTRSRGDGPYVYVRILLISFKFHTLVYEKFDFCVHFCVVVFLTTLLLKKKHYTLFFYKGSKFITQIYFCAKYLMAIFIYQWFCLKKPKSKIRMYLLE